MCILKKNTLKSKRTVIVVRMFNPSGIAMADTPCSSPYTHNTLKGSKNNPDLNIQMKIYSIPNRNDRKKEPIRSDFEVNYFFQNTSIHIKKNRTQFLDFKLNHVTSFYAQKW